MAVDDTGAVYIGAGISVKKWDGTLWQPVAHPFMGVVLELQFDAAGRLYIGSSTGEPLGSLLRWDGTVWDYPGDGVSTGSQIKVMLPDRHNGMFIGGWMDSVGNRDADNIAQWNGNEWNTLDGGIRSDSILQLPVRAMVLDGEEALYVGGLFDTAGSLPVQSIAISVN